MIVYWVPEETTNADQICLPLKSDKQAKVSPR